MSSKNVLLYYTHGPCVQREREMAGLFRKWNVNIIIIIIVCTTDWPNQKHVPDVSEKPLATHQQNAVGGSIGSKPHRGQPNRVERKLLRRCFPSATDVYNLLSARKWSFIYLCLWKFYLCLCLWLFINMFKNSKVTKLWPS